MRIRFYLLALPILISIIFLISFFKAERPLEKNINELIMSSIGDASFLNPILYQDSASGDICDLVFNGLLKYDRNLEITGNLASSWEVEEGEKPIITFHLRKGVRWQDGAPFTSRDVKFTYEKIMDKKTITVRKPDYEPVEEVEIVDDWTVRVRYKEPFSPGLESWMMGIIPEHLLKEGDINTSPFNRSPVGTGPFKFGEWVSDEKIVLEANPDYFEGRPKLDRIVYRIIPETSLSEMELLSGGVDFMGIYPHQYERMKKHPGFNLYSRPSMGYTYIGYNLENEVFKDKRVRQALTYAINREEIVRYILYNRGWVATGPYPHHLWYYNPDVKKYPYDPGRAKALLAEAGWRDSDGDGYLEKDGKKFKFTLITNSGNDLRRDTGVLVQRQLKEAGIDVRLGYYEWAVFLKNYINPRNFEACILGWSISLDPDAYSIWHSSQIKDGFNFISYQNPEVDKLLVAGRREYDKEKRKAIYYHFQEILAEDQAYTFLYVAEGNPALNKKFMLFEEDHGKKTWRKIKMEKIGLFYDLILWKAASREIIDAY